MVLWRDEVGSRRKARSADFDIFELKTRYGEVWGSLSRSAAARPYYKRKAEAVALVILQRGFQMLIGHATNRLFYSSLR